MVFGGEEELGIGGGCSCGGGGKISDQFGTKTPLLPLLLLVLVLFSSVEDPRDSNSLGSVCGIDIKVLPFWNK